MIQLALKINFSKDILSLLIGQDEEKLNHFKYEILYFL